MKRAYNFKDLSGKKIGLLKVLSFAFSKKRNGGKHRRSYFLCKCDCGKEVIVSADYLKDKRKKNQACGCQRRRTGINNPKFTGYGELSGDYVSRIKRSALSNKRDFNLNAKYLWGLFKKQKHRCALSNLELIIPKRKEDSKTTASLDRIDSSGGYVKGNVQWVHKDINFMKQELDQNKFLWYCKLITKNNK